MDKIAKALVAAQKKFSPALKSSTNPHFKSRYADLAACVEAVLDALNDNGIALTQVCHECSDGVLVETVFVHESGQTYSGGKLHVPASKHDPQGYCSALTYARRYALMAACSIAPADDDANAAKPYPTQWAKRLQECATLDDLAVIWAEVPPADKVQLKDVAVQTKKRLETK